MRAEQIQRIQNLKTKMLSQPRYVSIEQALIITKTYQENEQDSKQVKRAKALYNALTQIEIGIEPDELIVGNRTKGVRYGVVFPESGISWVDREFETIPTRPQDKFLVRQEDIRTFREQIVPYWKGKSLEDIVHDRAGDEISAISTVVKINQTDHAQGHICPNVKEWLETGPQGYIDQANRKLENCTPEQKEFYECVRLVMQGVQIFMKRYEDLLKETAKTSPDHAQDLMQVARICHHLQTKPANTFHEALQSLWFLMVILHMESNASSFSPGRLDQILYPYYQKDIDDLTLTKEDALELIECLWLKFNEIVYLRNKNSAKYFAGFPIGFNVAIGGQDTQGNDHCNELSHLFLDAQEDIGLPQPNLSVRLHEHTNDALLRHAVRCVSKGSGMPQFFNDKAIIHSLEQLGISHKDAMNYAIVGCVELTTQGNNLGWSDAAMFNLNKVLELTLNHGVCLLTGKQLGPDFGSLSTYKTFEDLEAAYKKMILYFMDKMLVCCEAVEKAHIDVLPTPFLSAVIDDCMEKGMDVTAGGAHYNLSGIQMIQVANLADSLAAIKQMVYDEKRIAPQDLEHALRTNFDGDEIMRQTLLHRVPKYGNDVEWVDELGAKWARFFRKELGKHRNYRHGPYHTGMYTVSAHVPMGKNVGASADGRLAQDPLADGGLSPVYGRDLQGPTAVLKSVSKMDNACTTNGGLLNMKFLPDFFKTETGITKFCHFLRTFVDLEIPHIQFNVVSRQNLLDAQKHPEQYRSLTVRVAGYTAYFTELAGDLQNEIIARTTYDNI
ncbi:glycyl radical protein [Absicoccus intestinalis]|uniref:Formate C-acetyltransferase/glycerol dehydratase family glycyl radical enzyme n=1 Tax=Absicoccus intestinalis TaxID=2926319 RepID=A0ABU4WM34_9FIRM|nr:formate C-acetyltransferase/glycerol dehydratase family glycyl radical enzyme [Absicoccus sp. CLA-KB-P134]MDX8416848.1 formate C-acetyltransferase/glycerol dehydratase family glycyl radical enzyme [Absicoccus sp. CLA-KB-P134]